ncbi:MAG TPA: LacI family transcriptional regulator [Candidatus Blautia intestinipullorum]|nr:LacI family transcriptional regulator [Candidatus Blautia intestinipullorum]
MESVTIKDIAKRCNVAVSTVSRAINNHPDINPETRRKIMKVIEENHYIPNNSAQNLKKSVSKTIGVVIKGADNQLFAKMRPVLVEGIAQYDYDSDIEYISISGDEIREALRLVKEKRLKGLIFLGGNHNRTEEDLKAVPVPFVMCTVDMDETVPKDLYSSVSVDSYQESYRMVDHLCSKGYKKIVIFSGSRGDESVGRLRLNGYRDALKANRIEVDEQRIWYSQDWAEDVFSMANGYRMGKKLIESGIDFDCVYAVADSIAIGAGRALLESGIRIPEECGLAGFDGLDETLYYHPSITTMRQPVKEMAEDAVKILFSMLHKGEANQHRVFSCKLEARESTQKE